MNSFAARLREARQDKNLTQLQLGKLLNVGQVAVSAWELGRREPSIEMIKRIAELLGVDANFLFGFDK